MEVSPNPAKTLVKVKANISMEEVEKLHLYDISGRLIKTISVRPQDISRGVLSVDVIGVQDGLYIMQMWSKQQQKMAEQRLVIKK